MVTDTKTAYYVYGVVPANVEAQSEARGVGNPPREVEVIRHKAIAALVSEIDAEGQLGTPEDLEAHAKLLDAAAGVTSVLPLRFGAIMSDADTVAEELLAANYDEFASTLQGLAGKAQYVVEARYDEPAVLQEVLGENPEARRLHDIVENRDSDTVDHERIALGEIVDNAVQAKREADVRTVTEALSDLGFDSVVREPTHELEAVNVACLAEVAKESDLESALTDVARQWGERAQIKLLGPLAPYDFVVAQQET